MWVAGGDGVHVGWLPAAGLLGYGAVLCCAVLCCACGAVCGPAGAGGWVVLGVVCLVAHIPLRLSHPPIAAGRGGWLPPPACLSVTQPKPEAFLSSSTPRPPDCACPRPSCFTLRLCVRHVCTATLPSYAFAVHGFVVPAALHVLPAAVAAAPQAPATLTHAIAHHQPPTNHHRPPPLLLVKLSFPTTIQTFNNPQRIPLHIRNGEHSRLYHYPRPPPSAGGAGRRRIVAVVLLELAKLAGVVPKDAVPGFSEAEDAARSAAESSESVSPSDGSLCVSS